MKAKSPEDLLVWQSARQLAIEISAILQQLTAHHEYALSRQLDAASLSVLANISEGFCQPTDRAFANFLYIARGSNAEVRALLSVAADRGALTREALRRLDPLCDEIARMLTSLARYLREQNRKNRG